MVRLPYQKINHFPGMNEICRKNFLARNVTKFAKMFPKEFHFFPKTYILPNEWSDFKLAHRSNKKTCYIVKPDHGCQGKGIYLVKNPKQLEKLQNKETVSDDVIVQ
jgi:tubulin polyglutamylase TTLL6/13